LNEKKQIGIRIDSDLLKKIDAMAKKLSRTRSNLIAWVMKNYLNENQADNSFQHNLKG